MAERKFTLARDERVEAVIAAALPRIAAAVAELALPGFAGLVLGGGYGRGEGGATPDGRPYNDLDFFILTPDANILTAMTATGGLTPWAKTMGSDPTLHAAKTMESDPISSLSAVSSRFSAELGVDVDFTLRTAERLKHDERRLMVQELLRGHVVLAPENFSVAEWAGLKEYPASEVPADEAARLVMNRGMGLLFAAEKLAGAEPLSEDDVSFVRRNINKAILGAGDALLISRGEYAWTLAERVSRLGDAEYARAAEWKARPSVDAKDLSELLEAARRSLLSAAVELEAKRGREISRRSVYEALRFMKRRRSLGRIADFGVKGETRVMRDVVAALANARIGMSREAAAIKPSLLADWRIFN